MLLGSMMHVRTSCAGLVLLIRHVFQDLKIKTALDLHFSKLQQVAVATTTGELAVAVTNLTHA
jgi:hypothetical protein